MSTNRRWVLFLALWTVLGLFFSSQLYFSSAAHGHPIAWGQAIYWGLGDWYEWALLSPIIFWVSRRFSFDRRKWVTSLMVHLGAGSVLSLIHIGLCALAEKLQTWFLAEPFLFSEALHRLFVNRIHFNLFVYSAVVSAWNAWEFYLKLKERELQAVELTARLNEARLQALRMQINPHFFFNTLHSISALMLKDVVAANRMISRLSEMMRLSLENPQQQEVPLERELEFLQRYLEIEQTRFSERLSVRIDIQPDLLDAFVPNMILQPLVENAVRHGIEPYTKLGLVEVRGEARDGVLCLRVSDNGPGFPVDPSPKRQEGIGLSNTRKRLEQLYGKLQKMEFTNRPDGGLIVSLTMPYRTEAAVSSAE